MVTKVASYPPLHRQSKHWHRSTNVVMKLMKVKPPVQTALNSLHIRHKLLIQMSRVKIPQSASAEIRMRQVRGNRVKTNHPPCDTPAGTALTLATVAIPRMVTAEMSNREPPHPN